MNYTARARSHYNVVQWRRSWHIFDLLGESFAVPGNAHRPHLLVFIFEVIILKLISPQGKARGKAIAGDAPKQSPLTTRKHDYYDYDYYMTTSAVYYLTLRLASTVQLVMSAIVLLVMQSLGIMQEHGLLDMFTR